MQNATTSFGLPTFLKSTSSNAIYENDTKQGRNENVFSLDSDTSVVSLSTNKKQELSTYLLKFDTAYTKEFTEEVNKIIIINLNEYFEDKGIEVKNFNKYNRSIEQIKKEGTSMYKTIYDAVLFLEKTGILLGILFSFFILSLPLYTNLNWALGTFGAIPSVSISFFLFKLVRGDR